VKYTLPFLHYNTPSGTFVPEIYRRMNAQEYVDAYIGLPYTWFTCKPNENATEQTLLFYPYFVAAWKTYHEKYLKPRMDGDGVLEFAIGPAGEPREKSP
jgi:hypothetical protein